MTARSSDRGLPHGPHEVQREMLEAGECRECSDLGYVLTVDSRVDWVWGIRDEEISDVPWGFVLGVRVGGGWGDGLGWRKVFEGKSWGVSCWALLNLRCLSDMHVRCGAA